MTTVSKRTEIAVRVASQSGALNKPLSAVAASDVPILATGSYWDREGAVLLVVAQDSSAISHTLTAAGFPCTANTVVLIGPMDVPAQAALYGRELAMARINVLYSYSYVSESGQFFQVFKTNEDDRAVRVLERQTAMAGLAVHSRVAEPIAAAAPVLVPI